MEGPVPNFFIVGTAKAGTTSLYHYLRQHPQVYLPPIKEVYYFATDIDNAKFRSEYGRVLNKNIDKWLDGGMKEELFHAFISDKTSYEKLFRFAGNKKTIGEMTNAYMYSTMAASNIHAEFPKAKIIMILRNPVERAFSHYLMDLRVGYETAPFLEALKKDIARQEKGWGISNLYVELGMYFEQVKRFMDTFPREQIKLFLYEDFKNNPTSFLKEVTQFLGVDSNFKFDISKAHNKSVVPKSKLVSLLNRQKRIKDFIKSKLPKSVRARFKKAMFTEQHEKITTEERRFLLDIYREDIKKLSSLIGRDLSGWLNSSNG